MNGILNAYMNWHMDTIFASLCCIYNYTVKFTEENH